MMHTVMRLGSEAVYMYLLAVIAFHRPRIENAGRRKLRMASFSTLPMHEMIVIDPQVINFRACGEIMRYKICTSDLNILKKMKTHRSLMHVNINKIRKEENEVLSSI